MESVWFPLSLSLLVGVISVFFYLSYKANFWGRKRIPHLKPVPGLGNIASVFFFQSQPVVEFVNGIYNQFPDAKYFGLMDMHKPIAFIRDPDLIKELCVKSIDHFQNHQSFVTEEMDPIIGKNVFALKGERWREMRNTLSPSFTATKMKFMFELLEKCASNFVQYFLEHSDERELIDSKDTFTKYTNDVIASAAFGISVDSLKDKKNEFYMRGKQATTFNGFRALKILIFRTIPQFMRLIGEPFLPRSTDRFFKNVVKETVKIRDEKKIVRPDMIHLMMEARDKDGGVKLTIDDIVAQGFIFFFAGFDTTSSAMCFVAHELAMNPDVQEKLRNEIDEVMENEDGKISYETVLKMKYLDMVVSETLRMYPPLPVTDRMCTKRYNLPKPTPDSDEYTAEPDSLIWIPIRGLHYDPKYFPDPEKFDPERFSDENKDKINPYTYLPFGVGPRKCIANRFALMETKVLFVHILKHFIIEKSEKTVHPIKFKPGLAVAVVGGAWIKLVKRSN